MNSSSSIVKKKKNDSNIDIKLAGRNLCYEYNKRQNCRPFVFEISYNFKYVNFVTPCISYFKIA